MKEHYVSLAGPTGQKFSTKKFRKGYGTIDGYSGTKTYTGNASGVNACAVGIASLPRHAIGNGNAYTDMTTYNATVIPQARAAVDNPFFAFGVALMRKILKRHFMVDVEHVDQAIVSLVPPVSNKTGTGVYSEDPAVSGAGAYNTATAPLSRFAKLTLFVQKNDANASSILPFSQVNVINTVTAAPYVHYKTVREMALWIGQEVRKLAMTPVRGNGDATADNFSWASGWMLHGYNLTVMEDYAGGTSGSFTNTPIIPIWNYQVECDIKTKIKIQNVSAYKDPRVNYMVSSITGVEQTVLTGKIMYFADPVPFVRSSLLNSTPGDSPSNWFSVLAQMAPLTVSETNDSRALAADADLNGVMNVSNAGTDLAALQDLPDASLFKNCTGYSPIKLNPGETKTFVLNYKFNGNINKFIKALNYMVVQGTAATNLTNKEYIPEDGTAKGTSVLFAFKEYVRSNPQGATSNTADALKCQISYDVDRDVSLTLTPGRKITMHRVRMPAMVTLPTDEQAAGTSDQQMIGVQT